MSSAVSEFQIPTQIAKTLTELTDEPRPDVALRLVLKDALEYRLEQVQEGLEHYRQKYKISFSTFKKKWQADKIVKRHSYPVEKDYWEWEGLISRQAMLNSLKRWL